MCDTDSRNQNLIEICDTVITGQGNYWFRICLFWKKPIIAGKSTYSNFGIKYEYKSKKYFASFDNLKTFKKLNKHEILISEKFYFILKALHLYF